MNTKSTTLVSLLSIIAIILSIIALSQNKRSSNVEGTLSKIQRTGKIDVCYAVWEPAVIKDAKTGKLSGHDIDEIEIIASALKATPTYHEQTFGTMAAAVQSGQCDISTSLFAQISRAAVVAFTKPLFYGGESALVKKGDTRFKTVADIDKADVKVAVATGESGDNYVKENFHNATITRIDVESSDLSRFMAEVSSGRADVAIADNSTIANYAKAHPETEDIFATNPFNLTPDNFALRQGDVDFLNFMNTSLDYLRTTGKIAELEKKYDAHRLHEVTQYQLQ